MTRPPNVSLEEWLQIPITVRHAETFADARAKVRAEVERARATSLVLHFLLASIARRLREPLWTWDPTR